MNGFAMLKTSSRVSVFDRKVSCTKANFFTIKHATALLQPISHFIRISIVMRKLVFLLISFLGIALAKSEKMMTQKSETIQLVKLDPRKNYRAKMAKQYFGGGGGRCHKWNRFCGR